MVGNLSLSFIIRPTGLQATCVSIFENIKRKCICVNGFLIIKGYQRVRQVATLSNMQKQLQRLLDMVTCGNPSQPKRATTTRPWHQSSSSHQSGRSYVATYLVPIYPLFALYLIDSSVQESTLLACQVDLCCPPCNKLLKYIMSSNIHPTGRQGILQLFIVCKMFWDSIGIVNLCWRVQGYIGKGNICSRNQDNQKVQPAMQVFLWNLRKVLAFVLLLWVKKEMLCCFCQYQAICCANQ